MEQLKEDLHTELKFKYNRNGILSAICAFANSDGGTIYIGYNEFGETTQIPENISIEKIEKDIIEGIINLPRDNWKVERDNNGIIKISVKKRNELSYQSICSVKSQKGRNMVFIRIGDANRRTELNNPLLKYLVNVARSNFDEIFNYEPSESQFKKEFIENASKNNIIIQMINEPIKNPILYKYLDAEAFLYSLGKVHEDGYPNLRFVEPSTWNDQYESRFYTARYFQGDNEIKEICPFLWAACFTTSRENEASWVLYPNNKSGLGGRCIQLALNRVKLLQELSKNTSNCDIYLGKVNYQTNYFINNLHTKCQRDALGHSYFKPFTIDKYLKLLLLKRLAFKHENELRIFIIPHDHLSHNKTFRQRNGTLNKVSDNKYIKIDWLEVIEAIFIDKSCSEAERMILQEKINEMINAYAISNGIEKEDNKIVELKNRCELKTFDLYKDESISKGRLKISV